MKQRQPRKIATQPFGGTSKQHFRLTFLGGCPSVGEFWKPVGESPPFGPYPTPAPRPGGTGLRRCAIQKHPDSSAQRMKLRSEEHTSELQSHLNLVCRLLLEKKKIEKS